MNAADDTYAKAVRQRLGTPSVQPPDEPVVCVRRTRHGSTLAVARYRPEHVSPEAAESIIRTTVIDTPSDQFQWTIKPAATPPIKMARIGSIIGIVVLAAIFVTDNSQLPTAVVAGTLAAVAGTLVKRHLVIRSQMDAAREITHRVSTYSPQDLPIEEPEVIHDHTNGVSLIAFPP